MLEIEVIPAKLKAEKLVRVAAYARVSSEKDAAFHSLEAQTEYYKQYVYGHPDWELIGIYSDNGISGTTINRPEFQRLLEDCREKKIDLVITKSVTRFARNTVILLQTIRELKALGIDCFFEKENMHSISPDGELFLTLLAMYAEEEARSASENQKWRIQKLYDQGKPAGGHTYGYRLKDERYVVEPSEAEHVREIYQMYLSGIGFTKIARTMIERGVPSPFGSTWCATTIRSFLQNERYIGDMILQKKFRENFRTKRNRVNTGELRKVYVKHSHEPIIERETFEAVQREIERRGKNRPGRNPNHDNSKKLFKGLIVCGSCGGRYRQTHKANRAIWICDKFHKYGKAACKSQQIPEAILIKKTEEVLEETDLTADLIVSKVSRILVPEHNHMIYELKDGSTVDVPWENPSRSLSWTPEMRQAARERTLKQYGKEEKWT
ncbi:MAG: recombinase family protein [Oscillibacter sp.]|nr:recombinase family protein [Oscillibacter sp.]